uniref:Uncharacterized protein n=1 Tax=Ascaris lumbricoides TaxID=6252 RepID=A0A9J2PXA5_ASCLU
MFNEAKSAARIANAATECLTKRNMRFPRLLEQSPKRLYGVPFEEACLICLAARCFSAAPPTHILVLDYFDELSKQQVNSAGAGADGKSSSLAALYGEFMKAYEKEEVQHGGSTIHGPHIVALIELIGETMNINKRLAKLSGSSKQQSQENVSNAERSFNAVTFADMNTALNDDLKFLKELNYTSAYVLPALTLLSAQLQQINAHIESLQSRYLNEMKFTEGPGRAIFSTVMVHQQTQVLI